MNRHRPNQPNQMKTVSGLGRCKMMMGLTLALAASLTAQGESPAGAASPAEPTASRLFPAGLPSGQWENFSASGYAKPVAGMVYRIDKDTVTRGEPMPLSGVPMGGLGTGCLDIEAGGTFGYSSIFHHISPRGGPLNSPFLGLSVGGKTWVLTTGQTKYSDICHATVGPAPKRKNLNFLVDWSPVAELAKSIDYWGHYPIVDMEYETEAPVSVGMRAWSPLIPGDSAVSNTPGAVFEVNLRNTSNVSQTGTLAFNFPDLDKHRPKVENDIVPEVYANTAPEVLPARNITREAMTGNPAGISVSDSTFKQSYCVGVVGDEKLRVGGDLGLYAWKDIATALPVPDAQDSGTSAAVDFSLAPGEEKTIRFVLAWYAPEIRGSGPESVMPTAYTAMYGTRYPDAPSVARFLAENHVSLLNRIIAWQQEVYDTKSLPGWASDSLINNLYLLTENSIWVQPRPSENWNKPEDGDFYLYESPRTCPAVDTTPCSAVGNLPVMYLFPDCVKSSLRALKGKQFANGRIPTFSGWINNLNYPVQYKQGITEFANYIIMLHGYWLVTKDDEFLREFYESAKTFAKVNFNYCPEYGLDQLVVAAPGETEWFEASAPGWRGYVNHGGGLRMVAAEMMREWAEKMGDSEYVKELDVLLKAGAAALEKHLWTGTYYRSYNEPKTGEKSDLLFNYQLDGQYFAKAHSVPDVFPKANVDKTLETIRTIGVLPNQNTKIPPNYTNPDGTPAKVGGYGVHSFFTYEVYLLGMTYMYEGQKAYGMDLIKRFFDDYSGKRAYTWDGGHFVRGDQDTGEIVEGADYLMHGRLWGLPAAIADGDISAPAKSGGLIDRMLQAGKASEQLNSEPPDKGTN